MKAHISISDNTPDGNRTIYFDDQPSHTIVESDLEKALHDARLNFWKEDKNNGLKIGADLYKLLNGCGEKLDKLLEQARSKGDSLAIYLKIPYGLNALPFELLNKNGQFLAQMEFPSVHIVRAVTERGSLKESAVDERPLKVLFMACSPIDLKSREVLSFENEEELILSSVEKFAVDLTIEDSGSLAGLFDAIFEKGPFDVVHITGHAGHDDELGSVFYMEDETGRLDMVTAERLWNEALKDNQPQLLFLSGCSTGQVQKITGAESFAYKMVAKGLSQVLGWGLPVTDVGATLLTAEVYRSLGMGKSIIEAVDKARKTLREKYHPWPLLRVFTDGAPLYPLIAPGQLRRWQERKKTYKVLKDSRVRVLEKGFVGRRREIQKGVRILKGVPDNMGERQFGVFIRGPAGIGKSCLAGKLIERFKEFELVVVHGKLSRLAIVDQLRSLFEKQGSQSGIALIEAELEYEDKIKALFRSTFLELPIMIYLDDFEQNLVKTNEHWELEEDMKHVLRPIMQALDWNDESRTRIILTSRYPFEFVYNGQNLAKKLSDLTLSALRDADLNKKVSLLPHIADSTYKSTYLEFSGGNPRLLEWLEVIAKNDEKYDFHSLQRELEGKSQDFASQYLANALAKVEGELFAEFMCRAAVYRRPVESESFEAFGEKELLEKGVDLTLFEKDQTAGQKPLYWVMPVIRQQQWDKLSSDTKKVIHNTALSWYENKIAGQNEANYENLEEAVHHAISCDRIYSACKHAIDLGTHQEAMLLYHDKLKLLQAVAYRINDQVVAEAKNEKDETVATLLNDLGMTFIVLGIAQKAIGYFKQALSIRLSVLGTKHPDVATSYNNLGTAYRHLGKAQKAIGFYEHALLIYKAVFGDNHPHVATSFNNLGMAYRYLGEAQQAIVFLEQALSIRQTVFGENHPHVATSYNNLGGAYCHLGEAQKAIRYYEQALLIRRSIFGDNHPHVATSYNNLGGAYRYLGEAQKAIGYYEQALSIRRTVFGYNHPHVAISYNNIGMAYRYMGATQKAIGYCKQALSIDKAVFGDNHPDVATSYNNLGMVYHDSNDAQKAKRCYELALKIFKNVFGNDHASTQRVLKNINDLRK